MKGKIVHKTLKQMQYEWKDELVNELYGENFYLIEEYNKHIEILNQIKEYIEYSLNNTLADERMILEMILAKIKAELEE